MNSFDELKVIRFIHENATNLQGINLLNEATQTKMTDETLSKMMELTIGKYNKIDFSDIEKTRGDVTKFKHYNNLRECIDSLMDLHAVTDSIPEMATISNALENIRDYKAKFEYSFRTKNKLCIMLYNTIVFAIMEATSYMITSAVQVINTNDNTSDEVEISIYHSSKQHMLINELDRFNNAVDDGTLMKYFKDTERANAEIGSTSHEAAGFSVASAAGGAAGFINGTVIPAIAAHPVLLGGIAAVVSIIVIMIMIREIIYWIFRARQTISEAAYIQAKYLEMNIKILDNRNDGSKKTDKIISKQKKVAKMFMGIAYTFSLKADKAQVEAKRDINEDKLDGASIVI